MNKTVLTIATGKPLYVQYSVNLAYSFLHWHTDGEIKFKLITDQPDIVPAEISNKITIVNIKKGEIGEGFSTKLHLDKLASEGQTLFIDSDCLIFSKLDSLFDRFRGRNVSVVGEYISDGEWFGDIKKLCTRFNIPHIPKFNGGIYYIEKGDTATAVYEEARQLEKRYDEIELVRLRNRPNDELLLALAMQLYGQIPLHDDGTIMSDPQSCRGELKIDAIRGETLLINPPAPHALHNTWYPFQQVSPVIVHFLGTYTAGYHYKKEVYRLKLHAINRLNSITEIKASLFYQYPEQIKASLKKLFRPIYHKIFGYRNIKTSERIM